MIRKETLRAFGPDWAQPTGLEVREMLKLCNLSGSQAAKLVGVSDGRTVRKWTSYNPEDVAAAKAIGKKINQQRIPFAAWAILAERGGFGRLWCQNEEKSW